MFLIVFFNFAVFVNKDLELPNSPFQKKANCKIFEKKIVFYWHSIETFSGIVESPWPNQELFEAKKYIYSKILGSQL